MTPSGIRMGTPALTTRGFTEADFDKVAEFFDRGVTISQAVKESTGKKLKDFKAALEPGAAPIPEIEALRADVAAFARTFPTIGFDEADMKFPEDP